MLQAYDAYGNPVEAMAHCTHCGCPIKHVYEFEGKPYGSTCIEAVSGIHPDRWVFSNGRYDHAATQLSVAEKDAKRTDAQQKEAERVAKVEATRKANQERYSDLIAVLKSQSQRSGDFCDSMAGSIKADGWSTDLEQILRGRSYSIVRDIWGKTTGGRRGSKAYEAALEKFDAL